MSLETERRDMSDFLVRWQHERPCGATMDDVVRMFQAGDLDLLQFDRAAIAVQMQYELASWRWHELCLWPANTGGRTECRIYEYDPCPSDDLGGQMLTRASAEAVCSRSDQFSRRAGRLYSLALALCEWDAEWCSALSIMERYMPTCPDIGTDAWYALSAGIQLHNQPAVKTACAEIVAAWRKPQRDDRVRRLYRTVMVLCDLSIITDTDWHILYEMLGTFCPSEALWKTLVGCVTMRSKSAAAAICAEIVKGSQHAQP
jgi:hypothetical protein